VFANQTEADTFFMQIALEVSGQTDDPKAKDVAGSGVGAIITIDNHEVSRSANVLPPALAQKREGKAVTIAHSERYHVIEHAERAAIFKALNGGHNLQGSTLVCTRFPCSDCARAIIWTGISRLVVPNGFSGESRWIEAQRAALRMFRDAGVTVRYLSQLSV